MKRKRRTKMKKKKRMKKRRRIKREIINKNKNLKTKDTKMNRRGKT